MQQMWRVPNDTLPLCQQRNVKLTEGSSFPHITFIAFFWQFGGFLFGIEQQKHKLWERKHKNNGLLETRNQSVAYFYIFFSFWKFPSGVATANHTELIRMFDLASVCMPVDLPVVTLCIYPGLEPQQGRLLGPATEPWTSRSQGRPSITRSRPCFCMTWPRQRAKTELGPRPASGFLSCPKQVQPAAVRFFFFPHRIRVSLDTAGHSRCSLQVLFP